MPCCIDRHRYLLPAEHYPVAICGGGPTGLTLSALLAKLGVPSVLFERAETLPQHPQVELALLLSTTLEQARVCDVAVALHAGSFSVRAAPTASSSAG